MGGGGFSGSTECQQGSSCSTGYTQLCSNMVPCANSTDCCATLAGIGVCEPPRDGGGFTPPDGGFMLPDGGFSFDAGAFGDF